MKLSMYVTNSSNTQFAYLRACSHPVQLTITTIVEMFRCIFILIFGSVWLGFSGAVASGQSPKAN
jgi:hypothetical protein